MAELSRTVHGREVHSFEELARRLGPDAVASPKRSTVPLVDYWRVPEQRLRDLWEQLGVPRPAATDETTGLIKSQCSPSDVNNACARDRASALDGVELSDPCGGH